MGVYQYRVRDGGGKILTAQMEAESIGQVREALRSRNLTIVDIKEPASGLNADLSIPFLDNRGPDLKTVALFSRQMSTLINAGVPLVQALNIMQKQIEHKGFQETVRKIRIDVETGLPLSEAMAKHPKAFNRLYLNLVRAGETSGTPELILNRIADFQEKDLILRGKVKKALTYPTIVMVFAVVVTWALIRFVIPTFATILEQENTNLPVITRILMSLSYFFQHYTWLIVIIIGAIYGAYRWYYSTPQGRRVIDDIKLRMPLMGPLTRKSAVASFSRTLSMLLMSGVNIIEALDITKGTADNAIVEESIENGKNVVTVGEPLSSSMAASPVFPLMVTSMVSIGEETGAMDEMLAKVADFYDREVEEAVESLTAAIEPIMVVFLGGIVLFIMLGMFLPMMALMESLGGGA